jgi:hypothetical protein
LCLATSALALSASASTAGAAWNQPSASPLNVDPARTAVRPSIASVGGTPYVAWQEFTGSTYQVHVAQLTSGAWSPVGGPLNIDPTRFAELPSVASVGGIPYVAWDEYDGTVYQIHVAKFANGAWSVVGGPLNADPNRNAGSADITEVSGVPYVVWEEDNGTTQQVRVARLTGSTWTAVGGTLNINSTQQAINPTIADVGGVPYVAWQEMTGGHLNVHVKRFAAGTWSAVGSSLTSDPAGAAELPSITSVDGIPYVAWEESIGLAEQVHVAEFTGGAWSAVGGSLNEAPTDLASNPSITSAGGMPYLTWSEQSGNVPQTNVAQFKDGAWRDIGGSLNDDTTHDANLPAIAFVGGVPYVAWQEKSGPTAVQIRVARLEPDIVSETATPSATGATLAAQVNDYGVPLAVGFEYGTTTGFGTATTPQNTPGMGTSTVTQDVSGLTPTTSYFYRAFGSDGFRETSQGAAESFTTLALPPATPTISNLRVSPSKFSLSRRKVKLRISYTLNVAASVTFALKRQAPGRRVHGHCVPPRRKNGKHKTCTRLITVIGKLVKSSEEGANHFTLSHILAPGDYRLIAIPTGGKSRTVRLKILS